MEKTMPCSLCKMCTNVKGLDMAAHNFQKSLTGKFNAYFP